VVGLSLFKLTVNPSMAFHLGCERADVAPSCSKPCFPFLVEAHTSACPPLTLLRNCQITPTSFHKHSLPFFLSGSINEMAAENLPQPEIDAITMTVSPGFARRPPQWPDYPPPPQPPQAPPLPVPVFETIDYTGIPTNPVISRC